MKTILSLIPTLALFMNGCETRHTIVVDQPKPMEVNINFTGRLDLVIHEARQDMEKITGEKAKRVVRPEDIGLPPGPTSALPSEFNRVATLVDFGNPRGTLVASEADLKKAMADRNPQIRALLDTHLAGESHTGLLAKRGELSAEQAALLTTENADRDSLYTQEAARRSVKKEDVALSYYLARLGHAKKGDWYEKYDKSKAAWVWAQFEE